LTNLNTSYSLLATVLFASCLGSLNPDPDLVPVPYTILHHNVERQAYGCPPGWDLSYSYCLDSRTIGYVCRLSSGSLPRQFSVPCPRNTECIGPGPEGNGPQQATCVPRSRLGLLFTWTVKQINAFKMQCIDFQFASASHSTVLNDDNPISASYSTMNVQVVHDSKVTYPPMPQEALLYYQDATYPIQTIALQQMETKYGSFVFNAVFDATQPLEFCVYLSTPITFDWALISYS
jgi:hypothetical protein